MKPHLPLVPIVVLCLAASCREAAERVFRPPVVRLQTVKARSLGLGGGKVDVVLRIENPNPYALTATRASYKLFVSDTVPVGEGSSTDTVRVGGGETATVRLPLTLDWRGLRAAGRSAVRGGVVDYRLAGEVEAATPIGTHTFPLATRGRAELPVTIP
jgi:LEA14-like dessication related protein